MENTNDYLVVWYSKNGFRNEGVWLYGHENDFYQIHEEYKSINQDAEYTCTDTAGSIEVAEKKARSRLSYDRSEHRRNPDSSISLMSAKEYAQENL